MNLGKTVKLAVIGLCTLMIISGLAVPAMAADGAAPNTDEGNDLVPGGGTDKPFLVINAAVLGDTLGIVCELTDGYVEFLVQVDTDNDGTYDAGVSGDGIDLTPDSQICLGGAVGPFLGTDEGTWHVKGVDYVLNGCDGAGRAELAACAGVWEGVDGDRSTVSFEVSMLARVQAAYTATAAPQLFCLPIDDTNDEIPSVCETTGDYQATRNTHIMGVCGEGTTDVETSEFAQTATDDNGNILSANAAGVTTGVQVFQDSHAFMVFDCVLDQATADDLDPTYFIVASSLNSVTCNEDDEIPDTFCFFETLPAEASSCAGLDGIAGGAVPVAGIVGEMGWDYGTGGCSNTHGSDADWVVGQSSAIGIDAGTLLDGTIVLLNDRLDQVDTCTAFSFDGQTCADPW